MNREKIAWLGSVLLIAVLAFQIPGTLAQRDDDYAFVRTLVDIHRQVQQNYVEATDEAALREAAISGMLSKLDPFSVYVPPSQQEDFDRMLEGSFKGVGIELDQKGEFGPIEVVSPIEGSPAFKAGIMAGDTILAVDGKSIEGERLPDVVKRIGGPLGTKVTLKVRHATGEEQDITMTREEIVVPTITGYRRTQEGVWDYFASEDLKIAYLRLAQFTPDTAEKLKAVSEQLLSDGMKGLILDMRFNPGGRLDQAIQVVDLFLDSGVIVSTKGRNRPEQIARASVPGTLPQFPLIVLVNEASASAAEVVAGGLMDNRRALVIGEQTYGKGSVQELIALDAKAGELKLTVAYYYLPSGRPVHRKKEMKDGDDYGVKPQIVVPMSPEQERAAMMLRRENELFKRPVPRITTQPTTAATTAPATQPVDAQLQRAIDTMIALLVLQGDREAPPAIALATTRPAAATEERTEPEDELDPTKVVPDPAAPPDHAAPPALPDPNRREITPGGTIKGRQPATQP
ncbi:MAG TPA: S41 family peptidase [Tepidisphaeraceae bacterium]|nr:S41 family peptidase [Tepidisphaeraceae bacterium]